MLRDEINQWGGKHASLRVAADHSTLSKYILPQVFLGPNDSLTEADRALLRRACEVHRTHHLIVRSSHESDWGAMVDIFPTKSTHYYSLDKTLDDIRKECESEMLKQFARESGVSYDPAEVTYSVAPLVEAIIVTLTEHPNRDEILYVDGDRHVINSLTVISSALQVYRHFDTETRESLQALLSMRNDFRESGFFPEDVALQTEAGISTAGKPLHFQTRKLCRKQLPTFQLDGFRRKQSLAENTRVIGVTPEEGIRVPVLKGFSRETCIRVAQEQCKNAYLLAFGAITPPLERDGKYACPQRLSVYVPNTDTLRQLSLWHQHTKYVQFAANNNGCSILDNQARAYKQLPEKPYEEIIVRADGERYEFSPA